MALNILVVDDSTAIRKILIRVLRQTALAIGEIFEARDGLEALEIVRNHSLNLVLSDINMPNLDGLGLLAELKGSEQWRDLPVVMITTEGSEEKVGQAIRLGSAAYIRKPFTAEQIQEKIGAIPSHPNRPIKRWAPFFTPPPHPTRHLAQPLPAYGARIPLSVVAPQPGPSLRPPIPGPARQDHCAGDGILAGCTAAAAHFKIFRYGTPVAPREVACCAVCRTPWNATWT